MGTTPRKTLSTVLLPLLADPSDQRPHLPRVLVLCHYTILQVSLSLLSFICFYVCFIFQSYFPHFSLLCFLVRFSLLIGNDTTPLLNFSLWFWQIESKPALETLVNNIPPFQRQCGNLGQER